MARAVSACRWTSAVLLSAVSLVACGSSGDEPDANGPAAVEPIAGSDLAKVTLTDEAAKRIDLQTAPVSQGSGTTTEIPYAALLYDPDGKTWTFVQSGELTFERAAISVDHIEGDTAYLLEGPAVGTEVVTVGATQLYGAEQGVGEDE